MTKNILLFHIAGLGDFVESLGVLRSIREVYKEYKIFLVVSEKVFILAKKLKFIDRIYKWPTKKGHSFNVFKIFNYVFLLCELKKNKFDIFVNFHEIGSLKGALMLKFLIKFLAPKLTIGRNTNSLGNFFIKKIEDFYNEPKNHYTYYCTIANAIGVEVKYKNIDVINEYICKKRLLDFKKGEKIICFGVGAERKTRLWLPEYFAEIANYLLDNITNGIQIFLLGNNQHSKLAEGIIKKVYIKNKNQIRNLCGKTSLEEIFYLIQNSFLVISTNSAIMHISANLGIKTVGLIGSGNPFRDKPYYDDNKRVLFLWKAIGCNPCYFYKCPLKKENEMLCMKAIIPKDVIEAVNKILNL